MPIKNILFPVDFSGRSQAIVPHVIAARDRFKASLTLMHFVHIPPMAYGTPEAPVTFDFPVDELEKTAKNRLDEFTASAFPGGAVKTVVGLGDPGSGIGAFAREQKMDLIMMPTRGLGRFRTALLGSVTAKTLHCATCPVWTDSHCEADHQTHVCWRNILCAVDTDAEGGKLIRAVAELTAGHRVTVRLVHAVAMPAVPQAEADPEKFADYTRFTDFLKYEAMQTITQMQKEADTHFHVLVGVGNVTDVIRHSAINHNADVVVIGRGVLSKFAGGLRSEVSSIVRSMPCPVLSV